MSTPVLILGESGSGKSTGLRNLDPRETLLIQAIRKPLPFRSKGWAYFGKDSPTGNIFVSDDSTRIIALMQKTSRPIIVIDDFVYLMSNEFMRRSEETGFQKFSDIGRHAWDVLNAAASLPDHKRVYFLTHTQTDDTGKVRCKTIGKLLDEKIVIEGLFSIVLRATVVNGQHLYATRNNGADTVKTPLDLFRDDYVENDLAAVDACITEYYGLTQPA